MEFADSSETLTAWGYQKINVSRSVLLKGDEENTLTFTCAMAILKMYGWILFSVSQAPAKVCFSEIKAPQYVVPWMTSSSNRTVRRTSEESEPTLINTISHFMADSTQAEPSPGWEQVG